MSITVPTDNDRWPAELHLRFARDKKRSVLIENRHAGPLVVQKAIYPEGEQICHVVIVHPPGGMAGGDELTLEIDLAANSSAVDFDSGRRQMVQGTPPNMPAKNHHPLGKRIDPRLAPPRKHLL